MNKIDINIKLNESEEYVKNILLATINSNNLSTTPRICGGWVRDKLMGVDSNDIDIMVDNMSGEEFAKLVTKHIGANDPHTIKENPDKSKHIETAKAYIPLPSGSKQEVDFARARKEVYHDNSRIPSIQPATAQEDAMRRDLTINSLFYNLKTGQVEDFTGMGIKDIVANVFRTPDEPLKTFKDDPLRIFRVIRFAAKYNGEIDPQTYEAMLNPEIRDAIRNKISKERIGVEFHKMLKNPNAEKAMRLMKDTGLFQDILADSIKDTPYQNKMSDLDMDQNNPNHQLSLWEHTFQVVVNTLSLYKDADDEKRVIMVMAALTHDLGKLYHDLQVKKGPNDKYPGHNKEYTTYKGHEDASSVIAGNILRYLKLDPYVQQVAGLAQYHMQPHALERGESSDSSLRKFIRKMGEQGLNWLDVFNLSVADAYSKNKDINPDVVARYQKLRERLEQALASLNANQQPVSRPVINGNEIMGILGIKPGPHMKQITEFVKELRDDNPNISKEEAIQKVKERFTSLTQPQTPPTQLANIKNIVLKKEAVAACPKHLFEQKETDIKNALSAKNPIEATSTINRLMKDYEEDDDVMRLAAMTCYRSMLLDEKTRDNNLLQKVFSYAEKNFAEPVTNAYVTGILLLIDTPTPEENIKEIGIKCARLSPSAMLHVIDILPSEKKNSNACKEIYESIRSK